MDQFSDLKRIGDRWSTYSEAEVHRSSVTLLVFVVVFVPEGQPGSPERDLLMRTGRNLRQSLSSSQLQFDGIGLGGIDESAPCILICTQYL